MFPLLWPYYCNHLSTSTVPDHVLQCYHAHFTHLPWQRYIPNLQAMNLMIEVYNSYMYNYSTVPA